MKLDTLILKGFAEIDEETKNLRSLRRTKPDVTTMSGGPIFIVPFAEFRGWGTRVLNLLKRVFSEDSVHFQEFTKIFSRSHGDIDEFEACAAIFLSAKKDYEGGFLFNLRALAKAEVLDDILEQAKELLDSGYKDAACILTGISLETALKELSARENIPLARLDKMNVELCKVGIYNMAKQKQITAWAELRNKAAHGEWSEYNSDDVKDFHEGARRFIADYL